MEITGFDYEIISNIPYPEMKSNFEIELKKVWQNAIIEIVEILMTKRSGFFLQKTSK